MAQIDRILHDGEVSHKELESIIRRLNHAAYIIPLARIYLNRFRNLLKRHKMRKFITLIAETTADFFLWKQFLSLAHSGIDINLIVERRPDQIYITDSCEYGIGGFSVKTGKAFRYEIPPYLRFKVSNNVLEYLAEVVAI